METLQSCGENAGLDSWKRLTCEPEAEVAGRLQGAPSPSRNLVSYKDGDPPRAIRALTKEIESYEKQQRDRASDTSKI